MNIETGLEEYEEKAMQNPLRDCCPTPIDSEHADTCENSKRHQCTCYWEMGRIVGPDFECPVHIRGDFGMPALGSAVRGVLPKEVSPSRSGLEFPRAPKSDQGARVYSIIDQARDLFVVKNDSYGDTAQFLGVKGQFADINRKFWKLYQMLWTETVPMYPDAPAEDVEQVLMDFIGHAALTIDFLREENNKKGNDDQ